MIHHLKLRIKIPFSSIKLFRSIKSHLSNVVVQKDWPHLLFICNINKSPVISSSGMHSCVIQTHTHLDSLTQWWKHFCENQFLIPNRIIWILFDACLALNHVRWKFHKKISELSSIEIIWTDGTHLRSCSVCTQKKYKSIWYVKLTDRPANETWTYGLTRSFDSPVNARFTFAIIDEFIRGSPSARYIFITNFARCRSIGTPSGNSKFLQRKTKAIKLTCVSYRN